MNTIKLFKTAIIMAAIILMNACKGKDGAVGPQGAIGATGAVGVTGPAGPTGAKGDPGTSTGTGTNNVIQVTFTATYVPPQAGSAKVFTFPATVTTEILDKSGVLVYVETSNFPGSWYAVPGAGVAVLGSAADVLRSFIDPAPRQIGIIRESGTTITSITRTRVVIIPAGTVLNGRKAAIDNNDYNAVKAAYNLPD